MPLATRRAYAGAAPACTLSSDINASATSFSITGTTTNWPTTATGPFYMVIDPGLSTEEKVLVGARTSGSLSSVTRAVDGTTAASHVAGATCYPVFTAVDANDANLLASRLSAKGDLISSDGTDPTKVAVGSNNTRLVADSAQTSGIKWVADTQNTVIDAKGDLLVGSANDTVARLAVGSDGHVLVADSTATNGLSYSPLNGWRNSVINGDFSVWQRGTSFTPANLAYTADRWMVLFDGTGATRTLSRQAPTLGNAISGQEPTYHMRWSQSVAGSSGSYNILMQRIENCRSFAGQSLTLSFYAKAASNLTMPSIDMEQMFGSGGSPSATVQTVVTSNVAVTTSWQRFTYTVTLPSLSGKTIGTNGDDYLSLRFWLPINTTFTFDIWGVQVESGSDMTTFERRPLGIELSLCQRYYEKSYRIGTAPGTATFEALITMAYTAAGGTSGELGGHVMMNTYKRIPPNITWYDHSGNVNKCTRLQPGVANHANQSVVNGATGEHYLGVASTSGTASTAAIQVHFVAECEL